MSLPTINPTDARRLLDEGATLIDIRESRRARARENSGGAKPAIVETRRSRCRGHHKPIIFHCKSGARTQANAPRLAAKLDAACEAFVVDGGLDAWRKAGAGRDRPTAADRASAAGADRGRKSRLRWHAARPFGLALVLRRAGFGGCRTDDGRAHRLLQHGPHPHAGAMEPRSLRRAGASRMKEELSPCCP